MIIISVKQPSTIGGCFKQLLNPGLLTKQQITPLANLCINMQYSSKINEAKFTLIF